MTPLELLTWRTEHEYTQKELANLLGVDKATVFRWEKADREIPPFLHLALKYLEREGGDQAKRARRKFQKRKG